MHVRSLWMAPVVLLQCRRLRREAERAPGYVTSFAVAVGWRTIMNVSVWTSRDAALWWSGLDGHVAAVRRMYGWAEEVWSGEWNLNAVSSSARSWRAWVSSPQDGLTSMGADRAKTR